MKTKVTRKNILLLSIPTILVVIISATLFYFFDRMKTADILRMQATQTLNSAQNILALVVDSEIGIRGYIITGDSKFLAPYKHLQDDIRNELGYLRKNSTPETVGNLNKLENLINQQIVVFASILASRDQTNTDTLLRYFTNGDGENRMTDIRNELKAYQQLQNDQLKIHRNSHRKQMNYLFAFIVVVSIFMLLYAQAFAYGIYRNIHQRLMDLVHLETKRSLDTQEALNEQLNLACITVQDSERKLEVTLNSIADGVIATDCNGSVTLITMWQNN